MRCVPTDRLQPGASALSVALSIALCLVMAVLVLPHRALSQGRPPGVSLDLQYRASARAALVVLPVRGTHGDSLTAIMSRDLEYSDRFTVVASTSAPVVTGAVNYPLFTKLGVDGIVQLTVLPTRWVRVALHDVGLKTVRSTKDFALPEPALSPAWRMAVHGMADQVEEWITGQRGIAQTRIAFTRGGRVWTVDSDGANATPVTAAGMSPQWVPSGRGLVFNVLDGQRNPIVYKDLVTGAQRTLVSGAGIEHSTPAVSPDGRTLVYARGTDTGTDLYAQPFDGGAARRITIGRGRASVQPSFSPDGQRLVFMSDRSGRQEVYISDLDGTNVELLTTGAFGDRDYRAGPDWSPDGRQVAFQSRNGGTFQIMTINVRDQSIRQLTDAGRNDDPSWAPDSRHVVVTRTLDGIRQLWVIDAESGRARQLTRGPDARLSAWSPRLTVP